MAVFIILITSYCFKDFLKLLIGQFSKGIDTFLGLIQVMFTFCITMAAYVTLLFKRNVIIQVEKMVNELNKALRDVSFDHRIGKSLIWKTLVKVFVDSVFLLYQIIYFGFIFIILGMPSDLLLKSFTIIFCHIVVIHLVTLFFFSCDFITHSYQILNNELEKVSNSFKFKSRTKASQSLGTFRFIIDKLSVLSRLNEKIER